MVNVHKIDMTTKILGYDSSFPLYLTATAMAGLAHKDGDIAVIRGAYKSDIIYMLPTLSSHPLEKIVENAHKNQNYFGQLYVNKDREMTKKYVQRLEKLGAKGLFITVDAPKLGKRESDMRNKFTLKDGAAVQKKEDTAGKVDRSKGIANALSEFIDDSLEWNDMKWFKSITDLPLCLKGVQCGEDALRAY